jgi:hypothetical protein
VQERFDEAGDRNWDHRSEWTTVPAGRRERTAFFSAATAREDFIRESIE